jgi:DNA-binding CsgD family transcriptional regulator
MRSKNDLEFTYMGHLQNAWYANEVAEQQDIIKLLNQFKQFGNVIHHSMPLFFAIDYSAQQYLVMTDAMQVIAGYHPKEFIENRMQKLLDVYHKDDFKIYNQNVFRANLSFLKNTPQQQHNQYLFSYNFRFMRSDNRFAHVLQRSTYITSKKTGLPLYSLGMIIDISDVKTDSVIVHSIEKMNSDQNINSKQLIELNHYYPDQEESVFTRREVGVLNYLAEGLSSKQIAGKLHISESTVINHKQNMMRKANAKNTTELIVMALRNRVI